MIGIGELAPLGKATRASGARHRRLHARGIVPIQRENCCTGEEDSAAVDVDDGSTPGIEIVEALPNASKLLVHEPPLEPLHLPQAQIGLRETNLWKTKHEGVFNCNVCNVVQWHHPNYNRM